MKLDRPSMRAARLLRKGVALRPKGDTLDPEVTEMFEAARAAVRDEVSSPSVSAAALAVLHAVDWAEECRRRSFSAAELIMAGVDLGRSLAEFAFTSKGGFAKAAKREEIYARNLAKQAAAAKARCAPRDAVLVHLQQLEQRHGRRTEGQLVAAALNFLEAKAAETADDRWKRSADRIKKWIPAWRKAGALKSPRSLVG